MPEKVQKCRIEKGTRPADQTNKHPKKEGQDNPHKSYIAPTFNSSTSSTEYRIPVGIADVVDGLILLNLLPNREGFTVIFCGQT